eukprot:1336139-Amphidinium_carterae.1
MQRRKTTPRRCAPGAGSSMSGVCFRGSGKDPEPEKHEGRCRLRAYRPHPCCDAAFSALHCCHCSTEARLA